MAAEGYFYPNENLRTRLAMQMMARQRQYPKNIGEGLTAIGNALADRAMMDEVLKGDVERQRNAERARLEHEPPPPTAPAAAAQTRSLTPAATAAPASYAAEDGGYNALDAQADLPTPVTVRGDLQNEIASQTDNPDMQAYLMRLNRGEESPRGPQVRSPTGASGPFQFTSGTGGQYGLVGGGVDNRQNDRAATAAAIKLTQDNAAAFQAKYGRPPTQAELALMHQQGAGGGMTLLQGGMNPQVASNLAANGMAGASPQQALGRIMQHYNMPNQPIDPRAQVTRAIAAQGGPQANPTEAGAPTGFQANDAAQATTPDGRSGLSPSQAAAIGFRPDVVAQQITPAPREPQITPVPKFGPGYIQQRPVDPEPPQPTPMLREEYILRQKIARAEAADDQYMVKALTPILERYTTARVARDAHNNELWKKQMEDHNAVLREIRGAERSQAKDILDARKIESEIDAPKTTVVDGRLVEYDPKTKTTRDITPAIPGTEGGPPQPKLSEYQGASVTFAQTMHEEEKALRANGHILQNSPFSAVGSAVPGIGGALQSAEYRAAHAAASRWIAAKLRKESGATISPEEFKREWNNFMPLATDDAKTVADKAKARAIAFTGMVDASGPGRAVVDYRVKERDKIDAIERKGKGIVDIDDDDMGNKLRPGTKIFDKRTGRYGTVQ